jgi:hypothetical protein
VKDLDIVTEFLSRYKQSDENPYNVLEQLYEGVRKSYRYKYTREGEKYIELDNAQDLIWRLKLLAGHSIAWMEKLEESDETQV